jgi:predicted ribosomally synthesized peptide with nif11-like leader
MAHTLDAFLKLVLQDTALQSEIGSAGTREQMIAAAVKIGAARGYAFSAADFARQLDRLETGEESGELSDALLGAVAGGRSTGTATYTGPSYGSSTLCTFCSASNGGKTFNR